jgi:hypothetical protein
VDSDQYSANNAMKSNRTSNLLAAVLAATILAGCDKKGADAPQTVALAAAVSSTNPPTPASPASPAFAKLTGKWLRPDGGYTLEIRSAATDGKLEAAYFNPRPIHVAKAEASRDGGNVKVFIELRDVNYPGSTYTLIYDPKDDQLKGDYFQAALKQTFDVIFTRVQP